MAKVQVYMPDELHQRAKAADLNLSGLLRRAVIAKLNELEPRDATGPATVGGPGGSLAEQLL